MTNLLRSLILAATVFLSACAASLLPEPIVDPTIIVEPAPPVPAPRPSMLCVPRAQALRMLALLGMPFRKSDAYV